jgi:hypothetical protein
VLSLLVLLVASLFPAINVEVVKGGTSQTYSGTVTITTTATYTDNIMGVSGTRSCTITTSFDSLVLSSGFYADSSILTGIVNCTLSYSGTWTAQATGGGTMQSSTSVSPSSGQFSGAALGKVYAKYENGEVMFGFYIFGGGPSDTYFYTTVTYAPSDLYPNGNTAEFEVLHPFCDALYGMADASGFTLPSDGTWTTLFGALSNSKIISSTPGQAQTIPFSGTTYNDGSNVGYTGSFQVQSQGSPPPSQGNVTFTALGRPTVTGLPYPSWWSWWVDLNGKNQSSTANKITFNVPKNTYTYTAGINFGFDADMFDFTLEGIRSIGLGANFTVIMNDTVFFDGVATKPDQLYGYSISPTSGKVTVGDTPVNVNLEVTDVPVSVSDTIIMTYTLPDNSIMMRTAQAFFTSESLGSNPVTFDTLYPSLLINHAGVWTVQASANIELSTASWTQTMTLQSNPLDFEVVYAQPMTVAEITVNGVPCPIKAYTDNASISSEMQYTQNGQTYNVSFYVTGAEGTDGLVTLQIPFAIVPSGFAPTVTIDGETVDAQFTSDATNYYVSFPLHFSTDNVTISFAKPSGYSLTINAWFNLDKDHVPIQMDGAPTGFNAPYTFTGLNGTHSFTVPDHDSNGNVFAEWETNGSFFTTIKVNATGNYTCDYALNKLHYPWPAEDHYYITPDDPSVVAAAGDKTWGQIIDYVSSYVSYSDTTGKIWEFPNETLTSRFGQCRDFSTLCTSMLIARGYTAYTVVGNLTYSTVAPQEHAWIALNLQGRIFYVEPQDSWADQARADFSKYLAFYYVNTTGIYRPDQITLIAPGPVMPPPAQDPIAAINSGLRLITEPVYNGIKSMFGNSLPAPISDASNYLLIEQPLVLLILLLAFIVLVGIAVHFIRARRRKKSEKAKTHATPSEPAPQKGSAAGAGASPAAASTVQASIAQAAGSPRAFAFCPDCGEKLPNPNAKFCPFCGAQLGPHEKNAETPEARPPAEAAPEGRDAATKAGAALKVSQTKHPRFMSHLDAFTIIVMMMRNHKINIVSATHLIGGSSFKVVEDDFIVKNEEIPAEIIESAKSWDEATVLNWLAPHIPRAIAKAKKNPKAGIA